MSKEAKKKIKDTIVGIETGNAAKRKRRAVSTPTVTAITVSEVKTATKSSLIFIYFICFINFFLIYYLLIPYSMLKLQSGLY